MAVQFRRRRHVVPFYRNSCLFSGALEVLFLLSMGRRFWVGLVDIDKRVVMLHFPVVSTDKFNKNR